MKSMRSAFVVFILLGCSLQAGAQGISLERMTDNEFLSHLALLRGGENRRSPQLASTLETEKCPFDLTSEIAHRLTTMSGSSLAQLRKLIAPAPKDTSILSPSGRFRVEFDLSGPDEPALLVGDSAERIPNTAVQYAAQVAAFFDRTYDVEVKQLGYDKPTVEEGGSEYRIVIRELGYLYGQTVPIAILPLPTVKPTFTSYVEIDNDFQGPYSAGLKGAKVTVAHEFHHVIQLGSYGNWYTDRWMHEMTSAYYEDFVFDEVNDYLQYLPNFFAHPERSLYSDGATLDGYRCVLFPKMLEVKYGPFLFRQVWERMKMDAPLVSLDGALLAAPYHSDLASEICDFGRWNYYTNYRSEGNVGPRYPEAAEYPAVSFAKTQGIVTDSTTVRESVVPFGAQYLRFFHGSDTVAFTVVNNNLNSAIQKSVARSGYSLHVATDHYGPDFQPLANGWGYKFTPDEANVFCTHAFVHSAASDRRGPFPMLETPVLGQNFPNPVLLSSRQPSSTIFPYTLPVRCVVSLRLYNALGKLVATIFEGSKEAGSYMEVFDLSGLSGGVYFYQLHAADHQLMRPLLLAQ